ncbi:hypothetical protein [Massilia sp. YIM B02443]|uniref:hypothetical protein n=1 Tax=Massilia sp. YIM B02443 TaxID=3050127 RepID=UPI0025B649E8|nr:hypothetical protein [Massilia sp. YIM B02443]MDN4038389.1 hypothetical protein [Massilia sp. YIM B02443]
MFKKLLAALGATPPSEPQAESTGLHHPYPEAHVNFFYNLLFCDQPELFRKPGAENNAYPWTALLADAPDELELLALAKDEAIEGRIRALAYNRLRAMGAEVPPKVLLGVIVEVPLDNGLDVLAAFSDGGVRYLNQSGKIAVVEADDTPLPGLAKELVAASRPIVEKIGPWEEQRLPPPKAGNVRITFLVSDGLYFGEGPYAVLQADDMAGPVLAKAAQLLQEVVDTLVD